MSPSSTATVTAQQLLEEPRCRAAMAELVEATSGRLDLCRVGRPVLSVLRPKIVDARTWAQAKARAAAVARIVRRLAERMVVDGRLQDYVALPRPTVRLQIDPTSHAGRIMARIDGVIDEAGSYRVIEHNGGIVGGAYLADRLGALFDASPLLAALRASTTVVHEPVLAELARAIGRTPTGRLPSIGYVTADDVPLEMLTQLGHPCALMAFALREDFGVPVVAGPPSALTVDDAVRLHGIPVDLLLVAAAAELPRATWGRLAPHPQVRSWLARGELRLFNTFSLSFASSPKSLLAVLDDEAASAFLDGVDRDDLELARAAVPWTRRLVDGSTTWRGRRVDLRELLSSHREELVLKPQLGSGGRGVLLGWMTPADEWERAVASTDGDLIAQERVRFPTEPWAMLEEGSVVVEHAAASVDVFTWNDERSAGGMSRLMKDGLMNLSRGSTMAPIFVAGN